MRAFLLCVGLACFLVVVITFQPFREVPRGRAGQQALAGSPTPLAALGPSPPGQAALVSGALAAASDVRRERPVEVLAANALGSRRTEYTLAPGTRLRDESGEVTLEGARFDLAGSPGDYSYGASVLAYGQAAAGEVDVWAMARDSAELEALASRQTALLGWPWLLLGLLLSAVGYGLAFAGTYAITRALRGAPWTSPHLAGVGLALYLMLGFGLLGSAWAMLWPLVTSVALAGVAVVVLAQRADRVSAPVTTRRRRGRTR